VLRGVAALRADSWDFLLVCTKTTACRELAAAFGETRADLSGAPPLVLCQNGWGNAELFAEQLPREQIYNARVITGCRLGRANAVEVTVHADAIRMGSLFGAAPDRLAPLCEAIRKGGIPCELSAQIARDLWAKLLYNVLLNPLGALLGVPYGVLAERAETRAIMASAAAETFAVMGAAGWSSHWPSARAYLDFFYAELLPATASHESSMLQDLRAGRLTEIDGLSGSVVRLGEQHDVATPVCEALTRLVHAAEARSA
jgi:2-dehydropantoate 2-reductase